MRIDTTLLGFDNMNWQRGNRSYVFKGESESTISRPNSLDSGILNFRL